MTHGSCLHFLRLGTIYSRLHSMNVFYGVPFPSVTEGVSSWHVLGPRSLPWPRLAIVVAIVVGRNMFGDILSDAASVLPGSLGLMCLWRRVDGGWWWDSGWCDGVGFWNWRDNLYLCLWMMEWCVQNIVGYWDFCLFGGEFDWIVEYFKVVG